MIFDVITIFPAMLDSPLSEGLLKKAQERGLLQVRVHNLRDYAEEPHRKTDDYPFGGGGGMIMKLDPMARAIEDLRALPPPAHTLLLSPQGPPFTQDRARGLSREARVILVCGRYEGVDERVRERFVDEEISIGDYVLTGGELPSLVVMDATARMIPGVLGCARSAEEDSFSVPLLDYPQYTRPETFRGLSVPSVLLSGDHEAIRQWRRQETLRRTAERRPDLLRRAELTEEDKTWLEEQRLGGPSAAEE